MHNSVPRSWLFSMNYPSLKLFGLSLSSLWEQIWLKQACCNQTDFLVSHILCLVSHTVAYSSQLWSLEWRHYFTIQSFVIVFILYQHESSWSDMLCRIRGVLIAKNFVCMHTYTSFLFIYFSIGGHYFPLACWAQSKLYIVVTPKPAFFFSEIYWEQEVITPEVHKITYHRYLVLSRGR